MPPPYYCMPLYPGDPNTCGGPRRDEHARVLNPIGQPIPGLYGASELGEAVGMLYPASGGNLSESVCFGRLAAEHALALFAPSPRFPAGSDIVDSNSPKVGRSGPQ
jgi:succinate dehydrogenase/fumarate reductase flavoprotein subunit